MHMPKVDDSSVRQRGRRPAGVGADGRPELVSNYPKLTISMKPLTKARLDAFSTLTQKPAWRIIDEALKQYMEMIPAEDKWAVEGMAKRIEARLATPAKRKTVA